ncbi:hypothetical protein GGR57DRAFT_263690 [Xylariaceae sp. FL1272]|nr:hypothetical protein GGR57DRAFT_263690 [Xylariaceae sp. FL1272]
MCVEAKGKEGDGSDADFTEEISHFTQLLLKDTAGVVYGRKLYDDSGWFLMCEYWPQKTSWVLLTRWSATLRMWPWTCDRLALAVAVAVALSFIR